MHGYHGYAYTQNKASLFVQTTSHSSLRCLRDGSAFSISLSCSSAQITTEKHRMSFPETVDEILDVSEDEGRISDLITVNIPARRH